VPFSGFFGIGVDELVDVEVLKGVNLVLTHGGYLSASCREARNRRV